MTDPLGADGVNFSTEGEEETEETEGQETEGQEAQSEEETWTPPTQSEWSKLQRQLKRANAQAQKAKDAQATTAPEEIDAKVEAARKESDDKWKSKIVNAEARALLVAAGVPNEPAKINRLLKTIAMDDIDVDEDGVDGLDDQIEQMKADFPELFKKALPKADPRTKRDAGDKTPVESTKSDVDKLTKMLRLSPR